jgi:two-component system chemotaxis response regulator CheB
MRVLVVEDDRSSRLLLYKYLMKMNFDTVAVSNGLEAIEELKEKEYEAVITDWMMPEMDGLELIEYIRKNFKPNPIIIVITAIASDDAKRRVLNSGADDYLSKPINIMEVKDKLELLELRRMSRLEVPQKFNIEVKKNLPSFVGFGIVASTGGPPVLTELFQRLKYSPDVAIFVVLHGPAWMLKVFSSRIQQETEYVVYLGMDGLPVRGGEIYLSPGDYHMQINESKMQLQILDTPPENFVKPSADPLFRSIASIFGRKSAGVVLTGMGKDGTIGSGYIAAAGGIVIAQNPKTATISSMPQSVIDLRIARGYFEAENIPNEMYKIINKLKTIS